MKPNQKIHLAGMAAGLLLLLLGCAGFLFAMDHINLNVTRASDPGFTSILNNLTNCTTIAGVAGLLLLSSSVVLFIRDARSPHPGNP